jgi:hypothetical protein
MRAGDLIACALLALAVACTVRASGGVGGSAVPAEESAPPAEPPEEMPPDEGAGPADDPGAAAEVEEIRDDSGKVYRVSQGVRGEPAVIGCADGQREAFVDASAFAGIAGCLGSWPGKKSMRARPGRRACGDDAGECDVPASLCASGWHVCGASGSIAELKQVSSDQCASAGGGRYSAAISHCETQSGCVYDRRRDGDYDCFDSGWCSETVCCGADCGGLGVCRDGVWPGQTTIAFGMDQGCGATTSQRAGGVLCCRD